MSIEQQNLPQSNQEIIDAAKVNQIQNYLDNLDDKESRDEFSKLLTSSVMDALKNIPDETKARLGDSFKKAYDKNKDDPDFQKLMESFYKIGEIFGSNIDALSVDSSKVNTLKDLLSDVDVNNKEYGMMLIYMCGKADDFISSCKENQSNTKDIFENFRTSCINELKNRGYDDVKNIVYDYDTGDSDFDLNFTNFLTLTYGMDFVNEYNGLEDSNKKKELFMGKVDEYMVKWSDIHNLIYINIPTEVQTEAPSETPTEAPSEAPTEAPSETPTEVPSETPTEVPSETPTEVPSETVDIKWPESPLIGSLGGVKESEPDGTKKTYLYNSLERNAPTPKDGEVLNEPAPELRFYEAYNKIKDSYLPKIEALLGDENLKNNESLKGLKGMLENIQKVLDNVSESNVSNLQSFLSQNLNGDGLGSRRKNGTFDGKFGKGTLDGLNKVLDKVGPYITSMETKLTEVKQQAQENQNIQNETSTETPTETSTETPTETAPEKAVDYSPLSMDRQYLVMKNSDDIAKTCGLEDVVFYSTKEAYDPSAQLSSLSGEVQQQSSGEVQQQYAESTEYEEGERICYMKYKGEIYRVRLDENNCLCPIAKKVDLDLKSNDGSYLTTDVLLSNINNCKTYLHNKLPDAIKDCKITWDEKTEDYLIESYGKKLTIEPMTIAGNWISGGEKHLSKDLALLNLSNKIRSKGDQYDAKNPDIKIDDNHIWIKGLIDQKTGKKIKIELAGFPRSFGLDGDTAATPEEFSNFQKFNNREHYVIAKHNFDYDADNSFYQKVY